MDCSTKSQYILSKNLVSSKDHAEMFDVKPLLELLHVNNDVNLQVKLLSTLSAYIMTNEESKDLIITYNSLYDQICAILSNCPPRRAITTFNFLSALLYAVDDDSNRRKSLIVYAKNMIRSSGCLTIMCDLFTSCMMHQDVWRSLCRCLAEICRGVEENQSYCTHLVPMCIQRCSQRNIEVFSVLQNLLQNHTRNINLFIESNGMALFQREFLQHGDCLQLLSILVQGSTEAVRLINESAVSQHMRDFLRLYGPDTQLGQWATIILYYTTDAKMAPAILLYKKQAVDNKPIDKTTKKFIASYDNIHGSNDTAKLLQNVMKEIMYCGTPNDMKYFQGLFPAQPIKSQNDNKYIQQALIQNKHQNTDNCTSKQNVTLKYNYPPTHQDNNVLSRNENLHSETQNSSFSFQNVNRKQRSNATSTYNTADKNTECVQRTFHTNEMISMKSNNISESTMRFRQHSPEIHSFKPKFASTPKKYNFKESNKLHLGLSRNITTRTSFRKSIKKQETKRRVEKRRIPKRVHQSKIDKENKHRSISGWFFETINESCTTLVKTVKNIFRPKISSEDTKAKSLSSISDNNSSSCSFSFTNYMRKRDAILTNECTKKSGGGIDDFSVDLSNSCHTCNDTVALKHKLANDEYLKQTVRKLKLGINLYGCDFKKISKQLWPQQSYMTPVVLYNLHRKLISK